MCRPVASIALLSALLVAPTPTALEAQDGPRPLRLEDHYRLLSVGAPRISADGQWVAYTVSTPVEETNSNEVTTWLVPSDGSAQPERVTHAGSDVSNPSWAPNGRLRVRAGDDTQWSVDPERLDGPTTPYTPPPAGTVSPDGRWRAVVRELSVERAAEPPRSDFERRHEERFRGAQVDWYPFVRDGREFPLPDRRDDAPREIYLEPLSGGMPVQITDLGLQPQQVAWRADGQELVFTADEAVLDELAYGRSDLFTVTTAGAVTRLTDDGYTYSSVGYSPDGRWISYVRRFGTDFIIDRKLDHGGPTDLYVRPAAGGEPVNLTANWDLDAGRPQWSPDSRYLYFTTGVGGQTHLFRVGANGGSEEQVTTGDRRIRGLDIDASFEKMTYTVGTFDRPAEVWSADIDGGNERRLTHVHDDFLMGVATSKGELVAWESYDGTRVEGYLLPPYGYDPSGGPYPLIVVNHGGPHSASGPGFNLKNQLFAAHGYFVFLPNFRSSTGYGDAFKWATWGGWGTLDGEDVLSGVDHLIERFPIDAERVGTTGHSYGGILTNWLITRYPDRFQAAVSGAGASNWTSNYAHSDVARTKETEFFGRPWEPRAREIMIRQSAYLNSGGVQTPTLFVHGEVDYRVPLEGAIQLYTSLKKQRVPTKLIVYEGMAHGIRGHWNVVHRAMNELEWWETYLKARPKT